MGKKSKNRYQIKTEDVQEKKPDIAPVVELQFKKILKVMSWTVGICFLIIITLPNFEFAYLDAVIKFVFYLGVFNLLLFILFEFFGESFKKYLSKKHL